PGWRAEEAVHLQRVRARARLPRRESASGFLHHGSACRCWRKDDADWTMVGQGRVQHRTVSCQAVPRRRRQVRPAMARQGAVKVPFAASSLEQSPAFVIDCAELENNCRLLAEVQERSGAKILLALKGFATWSTFPIVSKYLSGTTASGPFEARLGRDKFPGEVHVYAPAFSERDIDECLSLCDHVVFNSTSQWQRFRARCEA